MELDLESIKEFFRKQPQYVLYGAGFILLGVIFIIVGLILL